MSSRAEPVSVVFPPFWGSTSMPYLSVPLLVSALRSHGIEARPFDLNAWLRRMSAEGGLRGAVARVETDPRLQIPEDLPWRTHADALRVSGITGLGIGLREILDRIWTAGETPYEKLIREFVECKILAEGCGGVCIAVVSETQVQPSLLLAAMIRAACGDDVPIILGGRWCSLVADTLPQCSQLFDLLDAVAVGEADQTLPQYFVPRKRSAGDGACPGMLSCNQGRITGRAAVGAVDLSLVAIPAFEAMDLGLYDRGGTILPIQASRGCYHGRCRFCNYVALNPTYRCRAASAVADEMAQLSHTLGAESFAFCDDVMSPTFLSDLAKTLLERGSNVEWSAITRSSDHFDLALCELLASAGCRKVFLGLESGSQGVLNSLCKGLNVDVSFRSVRNCVEAGITPAVSLMVGTPGETHADVTETRRFADALRRDGADVTVLEFLLARGSWYWRHIEQVVPLSWYCESVRSNDLMLNFRFPRPVDLQHEVERATQVNV